MHLVGLHSQKGGTGKTSVGISLALEAIKGGKRPLLIDLDFSGTSLSDVLHFTSMKISGIEEYLLSPSPPDPTQLISVAEVIDARQNSKVHVHALLGDHSKTVMMQQFVYKEAHTQFLETRIERLIESLAKAKSVDVIIMDTSPGSWGIARAVRNICGRSSINSNDAIKYSGRSTLVSTADLNDVLACAALIRTEKKPYSWVINRCPYGDQVPATAKQIGDALDRKASQMSNAGYQATAQEIRSQGIKISWSIPEDSTLQQVYRNHVMNFVPAGQGNIAAFVKGELGW